VLATLLLLATLVLAQPRPGGVKSWSLLVAGGCLGLLVAAVVLLPGAHHAGKTIRAAGLSDSMANEWSMPPIRALELLAPYVLGHVDRSNLARFWGTHLYGAKVFPYYYSLYPGLLVGALALLAWTRRLGRGFCLWAVAAAVGYAISLGDHFLLWPLLRHVPGLSGLRYAEKAAVVVMMSTVVAASHGFDWFVLGALRRRRALLVGLGTVGLAGLAIAGVQYFHRQSNGDVAADATRDALRVTLIAAVTMVALVVSRRWRRERIGLLLCGILLVDLLAVGKSLVPTVPAARLAMPPQFLAPLLSPERDDLIFHLADWNPSLSDMGGLARPPIPARWGLAMTLERDFDFTQLRWTFESTRAWLEVVQSKPELMEPLLARRGVTAIVTFAPGTHWEASRLVVPGGGPAVQTLIARQANAFAFAASRVERVHGVAGWKAKVKELGQESTHAVCIEDDQMEEIVGPPSAARIVIARTSPMAFNLEVAAEGPGPSFVAINQTWDPGWHARLDGLATRVVRTDLALSGILVPAGKHTLELTYDDPWLRAGLWLSISGCLVCLILVLWRRFPGIVRRA
jgi:hypothetical protein